MPIYVIIYFKKTQVVIISYKKTQIAKVSITIETPLPLTVLKFEKAYFT